MLRKNVFFSAMVFGLCKTFHMKLLMSKDLAELLNYINDHYYEVTLVFYFILYQCFIALKILATNTLQRIRSKLHFFGAFCQR